MYPKKEQTDGRWVTAGALGLSGIAGFSNSAVLQEATRKLRLGLRDGEFSEVLPGLNARDN